MSLLGSMPQTQSKSKPSKLIPSNPKTKCPGQILQHDKGTPPFYKYFQALYEEFQKKFPLEEESFSLKSEGKELLEIAENVFLHFRVKLFLPETQDKILTTLSFLGKFMKIVSQYSNDLSMKSHPIPIHVNSNASDPLNQGSKVYTNQSFSLSIFESEEDIIRKVSLIVKNFPNKTVHRAALPLSKNSKNHLTVPNRMSLRPDSYLTSGTKTRSYSVSSPTSSSPISKETFLNTLAGENQHLTIQKPNNRRISYGLIVTPLSEGYGKKLIDPQNVIACCVSSS